MAKTVSRRIARSRIHDQHATTVPMAATARKLSEADLEALWAKFVDVRGELTGANRRGRNLSREGEDIRNQLVEAYLHLVKNIADRMYPKYRGHVDVDEIFQSGVLGLMDAVAAFEPSRGARFEGFAKLRIEGAVIDGIREMDFASRRVHDQRKKIDRAAKELEIQFGRPATDMEVSEHLGITIEDYDKWVHESQMVVMTSLDRAANDGDGSGKEMTRGEMIEDNRGSGPVNDLERKELINMALRGFSRKEKLIVILYHLEELTMREIGLILNLSESRVCQLHNGIITRLRQQLDRVRADLMGD